MATGLKLLGLLLCVAMAAGDHHMSTLEDLAEIQRDLYLKTFEFFNSSVSTEMGKMVEKLKALESRLDDVEGRLQDYAFKIPPSELASSCDAERALARLNSSLASWYERLTQRLASIEDTIRFIAVSETSAARTGNDNEVPVSGELEDGPEPVPVVNRPVTTTTRKPARPARTTTTRATTTRRRKTTTTLPPTTTTMPPTTTPTTTVPPTTTPIPTTTPMPTPLNCAEVAQRGETVSGSFLIDPMQNGNSFRAHCELPKGVTSIGHNATAEVLNNGFEDPGSFHLHPAYVATLGQMKALTAVSQNCSQFIKYRCRAAVLLASEKKTGLRYGYWVSVDGEQIVSWGGAAINSGKCACATTVGGCMSDKMCNCDSNPKNYAVDEGLITDKPYLPVTDVCLGDTGSKKEEGYVTLGPLRCQ
eukprot:XP_003724647.1 PREDICTED: uncharacterized protein LOC100889171 isoform X3 [Strongylocentrotus purpuratus]